MNTPKSDWITTVIRDVAELGERTSPDDFPDAMLVTAEELRCILSRVAAPVEQAAPVMVPNELRVILDQCITLANKRLRQPQSEFREIDFISALGWIRDVLKDYLAAAPAPSKDKDADWQPMEAAPKDRDILLLCPHRGVVRGYWQPNKYAKKPKPYWTNDREHWFGVAATRADQPIGWMELPTASQPATQKEGE